MPVVHVVSVTVGASESMVGAAECEIVSGDGRVLCPPLFQYPWPLCDWGCVSVNVGCDTLAFETWSHPWKSMTV